MTDYELWSMFQELIEELYLEGKIKKLQHDRFWRLCMQRMDKLDEL
jgi:hypothetical protein